MIKENSFEEYIEYIGYHVEEFIEEDCKNGRKLWELLHQAEVFKQDEQQHAINAFTEDGLEGLLDCVRESKLMSEELLETLVNFLDSTLHYPETEFFLDMILDYFTDL